MPLSILVNMRDTRLRTPNNELRNAGRQTSDIIRSPRPFVILKIDYRQTFK